VEGATGLAVWLVIALVLVGLELATTALVALYLAAGAVGAGHRGPRRRLVPAADRRLRDRRGRDADHDAQAAPPCARSENEQPVAEGATVEIAAIDGVALVIREV
jgi:membrane protein implicated in regulation of membrane protease activity